MNPDMNTATAIAVGVVILIGVARSFILKSDGSWAAFFLGSGARTEWWFVGLSVFASLAGGFMVFGLVQMGYEGGFTGYFLGATYLLGMPVLAWALPKVARRVDVKSSFYAIDSLVLDHYGKHTAWAFYTLTAILFAGVLGGQFLAISYYLETFGGAINYVAVIAVGLVGTMLYTAFFGFRGVLANDIIQAVLVLAVSVILPLTVWRTAASGGATAFIPASDGLGGDYGAWYPVAAAVFLLPTFVIRADLWQRVRLVERNDYLKVLVLAAVLMAWFYFAMTSVGIMLRNNPQVFAVEGVDPGELAVRTVTPLVTSMALKVVVLSGMLFALLSSVDSYLHLVAAAITRLVLWREVPDVSSLSERQQRLMKANARAATLIVFLLAGMLALLIPDVVDLLSASFTLLGILVFVVGWPILTKSTANADRVGAVPLWISLVILVVAFPFLGKLAFAPAILIAGLTFVLLLAFDRRRPRGTLT